MLRNTNENIITFTQENESIQNIIKILEQDYDSYKHNHVIIALSSIKPIQLDDIVEFLRISNKHRSSKKSFVIVSNNVDLDSIPDEICVVPTTQEAYDIIEMEEIERDLGF